MQGHIQISGDTIYGHTNQWLTAIQSMDTVIDRIIEGTRLRWLDIQARYSTRWNLHGDYEKYYLTGWWFNSHFIWTALFAHTNISIRAAGESYGLSPDLARIPLDELSYCHVAGQEYRLPEPVSHIQYVDQVDHQQAQARMRDRLVKMGSHNDIAQQRMIRAESIRRRMS